MSRMKNEKVSNQHLADVYAKSSVEEKKTVYQEWASTYDLEVEQDFGYVGPKQAARAFEQRVPDRGVRVLDAGCGTGLVGRELFDFGYRDIHGADFSPEMLDEARSLGIYRTLSEVDLTRPFHADPPFDVAISVGLYGFGPPHVEHLSVVVNAVRPGGLSLVTVNGRGWRNNRWEQALPGELLRQGLELVGRFDIDYLVKEGIEGKVLVLRGC